METAAPIAFPLYPATKFRAPPPRGEHIARRRCLENLTSDVFAPRHVLISATAGAGKSTLAAQWAASRARSAWISLSEEDDEPGQFWAAFILGVRAAVPGFGEAVLPELLGGTELRSVLIQLVDEMAAWQEEVVVVFDDLHLIRDPACNEGLGWLLEHAPPMFRVAICTRHDPPLPIGRMVARGQLMVLRGSDLQFDVSEAAAFLHGRLGLPLDVPEIAAIAERTDGWAAGLYLAALSLRAGVPAAELIAGLSSGDRRVRGYVHTEVLDAIDPAQLAFLERVSLLDRFSADLCDAVLETTDSRAMLSELVASNLFVIPLDASGTWFRLHHFFGAMLSERLHARDATLVPVLHARAGTWHRAHGNIPDAIHHFVAAHDFEQAGHLIAATQVTYLNGSRLGVTVGRWIDLLPPDHVNVSAPLCLSRAWVAGLGGREHEMERWLERTAALGFDGPLPDGSATAEGQIALIRGLICGQDLGKGLDQIHEAVRRDSPDSPWWPLVQLILGLWGYVKHGPTDEALAALELSDSIALGRGQAQSAAIAPAVAAVIHLERGNVEAARSAAHRAAAMRQVFGIERVAQTAWSWWGTACVHLADGRLEEAERHAEAGVAVTAELAPERDTMFLRVPARIALGRVRIAQGDLAGAREILAEARAQIERAPDPGELPRWLAEAEEVAAGARSGGRLPGVEELSDRELVVLRMLAGPATLREIGDELFVSHNTMKSHAKAIYAKLDVPGRAAAVERGRALGLLP